ncbi:MAG: hypothetical protein IKS46_07380 [Clostridia bacterium]|nr:hypothetical protein [Clostridia bacterium]
METLTLNDGTVLESSNGHISTGLLYLYIQNGMNLQEVFGLLIDPEKTQEIKKKYGEHETVFRGYTKLMAVTDEDNGTITAVLKKPVVAEQ